MKKKQMLYFLPIVFILLYLDRCTVVNISTSKIFKKKEYNAYPYLKDGAQSENYELFRVSNETYVGLSYDTEHNYFIADDVEGYKKISADGEIEFTLRSKVFVPFLSHFGFTDNLVYDFSEKKPTGKSLNLIQSKENEEAWAKDFERLYMKAEYVFYGDWQYGKAEVNQEVSDPTSAFNGAKVEPQKESYPIFMKIDNEWMLLVTHSEISINDLKHFGLNQKVGRPMIFLKDESKQCYSNWGTDQQEEKRILNGPDWDIGQKDAEHLTAKYSAHRIKTKFISKEYVNGTTFYFNIPVTFATIGYYQISKGTDRLKFKETGIRTPFKSWDYLYYFSVPQKYEAQSDVSFLKYKFPSNAIPEDRKGLFILRKKSL